MKRRLYHLLIFAALASLVGCGAAGNGGKNSGANYPNKTVTLVCPWAAGGGTDRIARFWADALQQQLGQPFVVQNRTGGSGAVGHLAGATAKPDGYTIGVITFELSTMHHMGICDLTYQDFDCLMQINADAAAILVKDDARWQTLDEFLEFAKSNPGKLKVSGTATGGAWDLARAGLQVAADVPMDAITWVPTKGAAPSLIELLGGHIDAVCCSVPEAASQIDAGQLRVLAVMADQPIDGYPDIPTARDSGVQWTAVGWRGLALPKGTPPEIAATLTAACQTIAASEEYRNFMKKNGFNITVRSGEEFEQFLAEQDAQWKTVIEAAGYMQPSS